MWIFLPPRILVMSAAVNVARSTLHEEGDGLLADHLFAHSFGDTEDSLTSEDHLFGEEAGLNDPSTDAGNSLLGSTLGNDPVSMLDAPGASTEHVGEEEDPLAAAVREAQAHFPGEPTDGLAHLSSVLLGIQANRVRIEVPTLEHKQDIAVPPKFDEIQLHEESSETQPESRAAEAQEKRERADAARVVELQTRREKQAAEEAALSSPCIPSTGEHCTEQEQNYIDYVKRTFQDDHRKMSTEASNLRSNLLYVKSEERPWRMQRVIILKKLASAARGGAEEEF